jgi:hypothetical protein
VNAPVFDSVPSPDKVINAGIEDEFTTKSCPPVPAVALNGPVPAPSTTPFRVRVLVPVPP